MMIMYNIFLIVILLFPAMLQGRLSMLSILIHSKVRPCGIRLNIESDHTGRTKYMHSSLRASLEKSQCSTEAFHII